MNTSSTCSVCGHPNALDQHSCNNCGNSLTGLSHPVRSSKLIFFALLILLISPVYWVLMDILARTYSYEIYGSLYYFSKLVYLGTVAVPFLLFAALRKSSYKTAALVFAIVIALIHSYWLISDLIRHFSASTEYFSF